jgi:hypothetical protein
MNSNNLNVNISIPVNYGQPDRNGRIYSREVLEEAVNKANQGDNLKLIPLTVRVSDNNVLKLGEINNLNINDNGLEVNATIKIGGTIEIANIKDKTKEGTVVEDVNLQAVSVVSENIPFTFSLK